MARKCKKRSGHCVLDDHEADIVYITRKAFERLKNKVSWRLPIHGFSLWPSAEFPVKTWMPMDAMVGGDFYPELCSCSQEVILKRCEVIPPPYEKK